MKTGKGLIVGAVGGTLLGTISGATKGLKKGLNVGLKIGIISGVTLTSLGFIALNIGKNKIVEKSLSKERPY